MNLQIQIRKLLLAVFLLSISTLITYLAVSYDIPKDKVLKILFLVFIWSGIGSIAICTGIKICLTITTIRGNNANVAPGPLIISFVWISTILRKIQDLLSNLHNFFFKNWTMMLEINTILQEIRKLFIVYDHLYLFSCVFKYHSF